jgi:hypothetical protein
VAVLAVRTELDGLLSVLAPLGLGAAAGTALVLDLDPTGARLPAPFTVAEMIRTSPTLDQLRPHRSGMAVLASGGATWAEASELVEAFGRYWPAVVVRAAGPVPIPTVPVRPVLPGLDPPEGRAVNQRTGLGGDIGPGPVLPRPSGRVVRALLGGVVVRSRWVRAWRGVWGLSWT